MHHVTRKITRRTHHGWKVIQHDTGKVYAMHLTRPDAMRIARVYSDRGLGPMEIRR
jgi:hypothetical protein